MLIVLLACFALLTVPAVAMEPLYGGFSEPTGIAAGKDGSLYVSNWGGGTVERIAPDGLRSIFMDKIQAPAGIAVDDRGAVYVAAYSGDLVHRVDTDGSRSVVATNLATPTGIAFSASGVLLIANRASGEIVSLDLSTGKTRVAASGLSLPVGVVEMADRSLVVSQYGGRVTRVFPDGATAELGQSFNRPGVGIVTDGADAVLVIDNGANVVRRVGIDGGSQVVLSGMAGSAVALGRNATGAVLAGCWGSGNIYGIGTETR